MSDRTNAAGGLLIGLLKITLTLGGLVVAAIGLFTHAWSLLGFGAGALALGRVMHLLDQRHLDIMLERWAADAVNGVGPIPPRSVRRQLARLAYRIEGVGGDVENGFKISCQVWADEQATAQEEGRAPRPLAF